MIEITRLDNGLRIVTDTVPHVDSVAIGAWFSVGARDEDPSENGIAHMIEHMMFKGTPSRSARKIAEEVENVGGNMNAYTSREVTAYFMHLLKEDMTLAVDVLGDILQNSLFDETELERERNVILQEIGMVQDTPDDLVFDNYQESAFPGQSVGAPILGRPEIISNISRDTLQQYISDRYSPQHTVISAAGNISHNDLVDKVKQTFDHQQPGKDMPRLTADYKGGLHRVDKDLEQSHVILGFEGVPKTSESYYPMTILSTLLGGGMSSRLFQEIREKRGLVYSIYSFHLGLFDDGLFGIYAGTGPEKLPELIPVVCDEFLNVTHSVSEEELNRAKSQMKADLLLDRESMLSRANQQAKYLINFDKAFDVERTVRKIDAVTINDVQDMARRMLNSSPTVAAIGPLQGLEDYDSIKSRLAA